MEPNQKSEMGDPKEPSPYDVSSPLWAKYHSQVRKTVKFPRGYREVSSLNPDNIDDLKI